MRIADAGFHAGRVEATTKNREVHWGHWTRFVRPLGMDPYLANTPFEEQVRVLTAFAGLVRVGAFGHGRKVQASTVTSYISSVGQTISLARNANPTKIDGGTKFLPRLSQMLDGFRKEDPPTNKKLPIEVDIPELLCIRGLAESASAQERAVGDLVLLAFYFLWRVGEYTVKQGRNSSKQTRQFCMRDVLFYKRNAAGQLRQLSASLAPDDSILLADGVSFMLRNQKNGWKNICIHHEANGDRHLCPVRAAGRRFVHIRRHMANDWDTFMSAYFDEGGRRDVTDKDISLGLKAGATSLNYPDEKGIPVDKVDTHSLRGGGANALSLAGYSDREIQKMGRWRGKTFMEYIREDLACFSKGMSKNMKRRFGFMNIAGGHFQEITAVVVATDYDLNVSE